MDIGPPIAAANRLEKSGYQRDEELVISAAEMRLGTCTFPAAAKSRLGDELAECLMHSISMQAAKGK
jgi:hypothetical protein